MKMRVYPALIFTAPFIRDFNKDLGSKSLYRNENLKTNSKTDLKFSIVCNREIMNNVFYKQYSVLLKLPPLREPHQNCTADPSDRWETFHSLVFPAQLNLSSGEQFVHQWKQLEGTGDQTAICT